MVVGTHSRRRFDPHPDFGAARKSLAELTLYEAVLHEADV